MSPEEQIQEAFKKQYSEAIKNPSKTLDGHIANENNITNDYRGRVLYEFFQNAVDRAESDIWIVMDSKKRTLTFANDGAPFAIEKIAGRKYSDFESLCSINTSSKNQNESIGNKGVGFKSCWEYTQRASIVSWHGGIRWGFELKRPCAVEPVLEFARPLVPEVQDWLQQEDIQAVVKKHNSTLPSFYFPRKLTDAETKNAQLNFSNGHISTIITLHDIDEDNCKQLTIKLKEFAKHEFFFVKQLKNLREKDFRIRIQIDSDYERIISTQENTEKWLDGNVVVKDFTPVELEELRELSRALHYEVEFPSVAIAFSLLDDENEKLESRFYTYLPTEVSCGFNVLIHADFLLDVSRKNIDFADNKYNQRLLEHVADLLVDVLLKRTELHGLEHFSKFLIPNDREDALAKMVWQRLTEKSRLTEILRKVYQGKSSEKSCQLAFSVIDQWIEKHREREIWSEYYDRVYDETLRYFCDSDVKFVYVDEGVVSSLPPKPQKEAEEKRKLFYIAKNNDTQELSLLKDIESITLSGMDELSKPEFIKNRIVLENSNIEILRALASESETTDSSEIREAIIRFIVGRQKTFDGRLNVVHFSPQGNSPKDGHFLAKIMLPCNDGWHPANQCYFDLDDNIKVCIDKERFFEIDVSRFKQLLPDSNLDIQDALRFFGATNRLPIGKVTTSNKIELFLPWKSTPELVGSNLKALINASMEDWDSIGNIDYIYQLLKKGDWFYDDKHKSFCKPAEVFLFNDDVIRPAICQERRDSNLNLLYENMGFRAIDETSDNQKLLLQLEKLKDAPGQICRLHKTLYRQIVLRLSRNKAETTDSAKQMSEIPLLCEGGYVEEGAWFVGRDSKKFKHHFSELRFLLFDDEVTMSFIRALGDRVKIFDPKFRPQPEKELSKSTSDHEEQTIKFKQYIENNYLADMFAIAEDALPATRFVKEHALSRWQNLVIQFADDVWIEANLEGKMCQIGFEKEDSDVFFLPISESDRASHSDRIGQLIHDLKDPLGSGDFPKFGEAIANGVFRDINLGPVLRSFLTEASKGDSHRESFLCERGIDQSDVEEMRSFIQEALITDEEKLAMIEQIKGLGIDNVDSTNWNKLETYLSFNKSFSDLENLFEDDRRKSIIRSLSPAVRNIQQVREKKKYIQLCYFLDKGEKLSDEYFFSKVDSKAVSSVFEMFNFSVESAMEEIFGIEKTSRTETELIHGQIRLEADNLPRFDLAPEDSGSRPLLQNLKDEVHASQNNIRSVSITAASREKQSRDQGRRGVAVERLLCVEYARNIIDKNLQEELKIAITELYAGESFAKDYLQKNDGSQMELDELIDCLHVSKSIGDGLGYDILEPVINNSDKIKINRVEVKSSQGGSSFYLSRNEFSKILGVAKNNDRDWRLYHVILDEGRTYDRTNAIVEAVKQYNDLVIQNIDDLALAPDTWVISFDKLKSDNLTPLAG